MLRGQLRRDEPLAKHTSWRVGGVADCFYQPADTQDLIKFVRGLAADEPVCWLGLGSNVLVRDGGIRGTVICSAGMKADIKALADCRWHVDAAANDAKVARVTARENCCGAEFLAGIPGTFGGALAMNAGAFGGETWPLVEQVTTLARDGSLHQRSPAEYRIHYRHVDGPPDWFLSAIVKLRPGKSDSNRIRALLDKRKQSQPIGLPSCGSVFKNPPPDAAGNPRYAAQLIEAAGLKGYRIGGAEVSPKHANFIINTGTACAADIEALLRHVQAAVKSQFGVKLETEARIVGEEKRS
jgi:UDP-N-acetylmuramate dehydrogenase